MTLPTLTPKQKEILVLLYRYRFLNRPQIQLFLNHKYHKRINDWLNDLTTKSYISRLYTKAYPDNTKPAVYSLAKKGIHFLKEEYITSDPELLRNLYRENQRSQAFIERCTLLGDISLTLFQANDQFKREGRKIKYEVVTASDFLSPESPFQFLNELNPDFIFLKHEKETRDITTQPYLLEVIAPTLPLYSLRKRLKIYLEFYLENEWETEIDLPFPIILFICPTTATLIYAKRRMKKLIREEEPEDFQVWFTTIPKLNEHGASDTIWEIVHYKF